MERYWEAQQKTYVLQRAVALHLSVCHPSPQQKLIRTRYHQLLTLLHDAEGWPAFRSWGLCQVHSTFQQVAEGYLGALQHMLQTAA